VRECYGITVVVIYWCDEHTCSISKKMFLYFTFYLLSLPNITSAVIYPAILKATRSFRQLPLLTAFSIPGFFM
jgi:hypothetical protein